MLLWAAATFLRGASDHRLHLGRARTFFEVRSGSRDYVDFSYPHYDKQLRRRCWRRCGAENPHSAAMACIWRRRARLERWRKSPAWSARCDVVGRHDRHARAAHWRAELLGAALRYLAWRWWSATGKSATSSPWPNRGRAGRGIDKVRAVLGHVRERLSSRPE